MKKMVSVLAGVLVLLCLQFASRAANPADTLKITNVTAAKPIVRGVENEFTVEVEYNLESKGEGIIAIGFNMDQPIAFRMLDSLIVKRGANTATLKVKVVPVDWGEKAKFMVMANLSEHPHGLTWQPLSMTVKEIAIEQ